MLQIFSYALLLFYSFSLSFIASNNETNTMDDKFIFQFENVLL